MDYGSFVLQRIPTQQSECAMPVCSDVLFIASREPIGR